MQETAAFQKGSVLLGTTKKHPHSIVVLKIMKQGCYYQIKGGQHGTKKQQYLSLEQLAHHYKLVKL